MTLTTVARRRPRNVLRTVGITLDLHSRRTVGTIVGVAAGVAFGLSTLLLWLGCLIAERWSWTRAVLSGSGHFWPGCVTGGTLAALCSAQLAAATARRVQRDAEVLGADRAQLVLRLVTRRRGIIVPPHPFSSLGPHMTLAPLPFEWCPADRPYNRRPFYARPPSRSVSRGPGR